MFSFLRHLFYGPEYELVDFGSNCLPSVLIRNILGNPTKSLFMLGLYPFNDILSYLEEGDLEAIYCPSSLRYQGNPVSTSDDIQHYEHDNGIENIKLNFAHLHEYAVDKETLTLTNYEFVKKGFDEKIFQFKTLYDNYKIPIFIHFQIDSQPISSLKIREMVLCLTRRISKRFYLFIFSNSHVKETSCFTCVKYVYLDRPDYDRWWQSDTPLEQKMGIYKEMYEKYMETFRSICPGSYAPLYRGNRRIIRNLAKVVTVE